MAVILACGLSTLRGPAGVFRALRTIPVMLDICRDIERYCPHAIFLNDTHPMSMPCRAMQGQSKVQVTGLCHSVQGTAEMLAQNRPWLPQFTTVD